MDSFEPGYDRFASGPLWDPKVLLILIGLAVALAVIGAAIGWTLSQNDARQRHRASLENHWKALWQRGYWAGAAPGASVLHQADLLAQEIEKRLGPLAAFGGPLAKALKDLKDAGAAKAPAKAEAKPAAKAEEKKDGGQAVAAGGTTTINIVAAPPASGPAAAEAKDPKDQARLAIGRFNDFWSQKDARMKELEAALDCLLHAEPPATSSTQNTAGGSSKPVWDSKRGA